MNELSIFVDESGSDNLRDRYYLITLVLHEQADPLAGHIARYEQSLGDKGLPDIPFRVFFRHLPILYACLEFKMKELEDAEAASPSASPRLARFRHADGRRY